MKQTALKRDEEQVQAIINHLNETMTDSFDIEAHPPCLMNISTGMHATREVQDSLLSAFNEGEKKCRKFVNSALSVVQSVSFYSPISKSQLKPFEHMNAKTSLKYKSGEIITVISTQKLFSDVLWFWLIAEMMSRLTTFFTSCRAYPGVHVP